jgi:hypothetical protein
MNIDAYTPTDDDVEEVCTVLCQSDAAGVTMWNWPLHFNEPGWAEAMDRIAAVCAGEPVPPPTSTAVLPTPTGTAISPTATPTDEPPTPTATSEPGGAIVVDHTSYASALTQAQLDAARALDVLFAHKSIGANVMDGLDDLTAQNWTRYHVDSAYNASASWWAGNNGIIEDTTFGDNLNLLSKIDGFDDHVRGGYHAGDVVIKFCYGDLPPWASTPTATVWQEYRDMMLALEAACPDTVFVWWTVPLMGSSWNTGNDQKALFNGWARAFCAANGKVLFDFADIESHAAGGAPVTGGDGSEAAWEGWTYDKKHLNEAGRRRVASALWALLVGVYERWRRMIRAPPWASSLHAFARHTVAVYGSRNVIDGLEVTNAGERGIAVRGAGNLIRRCDVHHNYKSGILVGGQDNVIEDCVVWQNSQRTHVDGRTSGCLSATGATRAVFRRNIVFNNWGEAMSAFKARGTITEDNVIYDNAAVCGGQGDVVGDPLLAGGRAPRYQSGSSCGPDTHVGESGP